ncbi:MAG TPA: M12 family metallo-peptidase [Thermoanaerobaculia bacterium]|nr:M12 family metallo-peptidase [Thermoanaerobaculia bacterium]
MRSSRILIAVILSLAAFGAHAVTYIVPADRELIQRSDDIVVAAGVTSLVERAESGGIITRYTLRIEEVLKGKRSAGQHLVLTERGGAIGDQIQYIPGTPEYQPGRRYLVFTETNRHGDPVTFGMALGQFFFTEHAGRRLALRADVEGFNGNLDSHVEVARDAAKFLDYVRGVMARRPDVDSDYFVKQANPRFEIEGRGVAVEASRGSYQMTSSGRPFRWSQPSASFVKSGVAVGANGGASVALAFAQWNGTNSEIDYRDAGQDNTALGGVAATDGKNAILFNDPLGVVGSGIAGVGGITAGGDAYSIGGETFWDMFEVDVVMNDIAFGQSCYDTVMVHEVGHTLGFRHSNQNSTSDGPCVAPGPCNPAAIMNSSVQCAWKGGLMEYDLTAAATVYGNGILCTMPAIREQPLSAKIRANTHTTLSVAATGTDLRYQWYEGDEADDSNPVGDGRWFYTTPNLTKPASFWVRVSNSCGTADSDAAAITLQFSKRRAVGHP